jgi:uncharacterized membrane protein
MNTYFWFIYIPWLIIILGCIREISNIFTIVRIVKDSKLYYNIL